MLFVVFIMIYIYTYILIVIIVLFVYATGVISDPCISEHVCCRQGLFDSGGVGGANYVVFWYGCCPKHGPWCLCWFALALLPLTGSLRRLRFVFWWSTWFFLFVT